MSQMTMKTCAQVGYVIRYIIFMGIIRITQKPFLIPYVNFDKKSFDVISGNLWFVMLEIEIYFL